MGHLHDITVSLEFFIKMFPFNLGERQKHLNCTHYCSSAPWRQHSRNLHQRHAGGDNTELADENKY